MAEVLDVELADLPAVEIVAAVRAGAALGDRIDMAMRFGREVLRREQLERDLAAARAAEADRARQEALRRGMADADYGRLADELEGEQVRVLYLERLLERACVNGGGRFLREAGLA